MSKEYEDSHVTQTEWYSDFRFKLPVVHTDQYYYQGGKKKGCLHQEMACNRHRIQKAEHDS